MFRCIGDVLSTTLCIALQGLSKGVDVVSEGDLAYPHNETKVFVITTQLNYLYDRQYQVLL